MRQPWGDAHSSIKSSGVRPATAGAAILAGTFGSMMSPGSSHSAMLSEMSGLTVTQVNLSHAPYTMIAGAIGAVMLTILAIVFKDYGKNTVKRICLKIKRVSKMQKI